MSAPACLAVTAPAAAVIPVRQRHACSACGVSRLEEILALPDFPLTGVFVHPAQRAEFPSFDQALLRCAGCGHAQLRDTVDPTYLYQDTYTHRSSLSPISTRGNDFFAAFVEEIAAGRHFESIVEIGCNDLYLLKRLAGRGDHLLGFDPIWKGRTPADRGRIQVSDKYIEEIAPAADIPVRPDLVLSVHTLEHVNDPLHSLQPIFDHAQEGALFVVEVPGFDTLVNIARFDQVFHQHLNYFSVASFQRMIAALGGEYLTHRFNRSYWLGTMLIAFRKPAASGRGGAPAHFAPPPARDDIQAQFSLFRQQLDSLRRSLDRLTLQGEPIYGYGAAQMAPTIAYHLQSDFGFLRAILDENPAKTGLTYPSLKPLIESADAHPSLAHAAVLVTAADSARPILRKVTDLRARFVLNPFNPF